MNLQQFTKDMNKVTVFSQQHTIPSPPCSIPDHSSYHSSHHTQPGLYDHNNALLVSFGF